jgi:AAA family ATP:ADP antiporter
MFFNVALLIAAYTTTKAVRDAVFLARFGLIQLSYLMIGVAVVAGFLVSAFNRYTTPLRRDLAIVGSHAFTALTLVAIALGLSAGVGWLAWALYCWSSLFGLILVAQFWLLANDLFDAREAKRLFPALGAGGILGGILGGAVPGWLARPLGASNLLYLVAAELLGAALLSHLAWRMRRHDVSLEPIADSRRLVEGLATMRQGGYVRLLAWLMVCMTVCATLLQWQVKGIAKVAYGGRLDEMAAFFGRLAMGLNVASFALQILATPRLLRRFGVAVGLRLLPGGFAIGAIGLLASLVAPILALPAAALAMTLSDGLRFSVDKAATELLYLPVPRSLKNRVKPFIDTVVDRFAGAVSGFVWIALTLVIHIDRPSRIAFGSLIILGVIAVWLALVARAHAGYLDAYRHMLGRAATPAKLTPRTHAAEVEPELRGAALRLRLITRALRAAQERRARWVAQALARSLDEALDRTAGLLERVCVPSDVVLAMAALRRSSRPERAGALELLDNQLEGAAKVELIDALEEVGELRLAG